MFFFPSIAVIDSDFHLALFIILLVLFQIVKTGDSFNPYEIILPERCIYFDLAPLL